MKNLICIFAGIITGFIVISLVQMAGAILVPPPTNFNYTNKEASKFFVESLSVESLLIVILARAVGSFLGGLVTSLIASENKIESALITGIVLLIAGLINLISTPHPWWFWVLGLAVYLPGAYLGGKLGAALNFPKPTAE